MKPNRVAPVERPRSEEIASVLAGSSNLPYAYLPGISSEQVLNYALAAAADLAGRERARTFRAPVEGPAGAFAVYQPLPWDSEVLEVPSGRVGVLELGAGIRRNPAHARRVAGDLAAAMIHTAREDGVRYLTVRIPAADVVVLQGLESQGFQMVDGILKFALPVAPGTPDREEGVPVREATPADVPALRALAEEGFIYDRFHNDPLLPAAAADRLHGEWVENAVRGKTGSTVLVAEADGRPAGFFILAEDALAREHLGIGVGVLVLITVARWARRRGLARALSLASARWLADRDNTWVEVGTQLANLPAGAVYVSAGFRLVQTTLTLRWWGGVFVISRRVLVIIPAYKEAPVIAKVIREVRETHPTADVVVVDDCSPDDTGDRARAEGAAVLPLPVNLGIGGAVQTGFKYAVAGGYDAVVQVDGDGQHDPGELDKILAPLWAGKADVVIGSRFLLQTRYKAPLARRVGMIVFSAVAHRAMGQRITDTTSGFRALNRRAVQYLAKNYPVDFPDAETLVLLKRAGFRLHEVSVNMRPRLSGKSSTTTLKSMYYPFKQLLSILVVLLRDPPPAPNEAPGGSEGGTDPEGIPEKG